MSADPDRPLVLGLRARLVLALVLTAALTLGVAAVTLLGPLERRLRNQAGTQLESAAQAAALQIDELSAPPRPGGRALRPVLIRLRRHADAEATVVDARGRILATTDRTPGEYLPLARAVARSGRQRRLTAPTNTGDEVVVAVPLSPPGPQLGLVAIRPLDAVRATARSERRAFTVAAAVGLAVAIAVGVLLAERLARRLRRLRAAALRLVELGPEVEFVPDQHRDEVGELSRAFAHVQAGINRQERARRTFVATASHELRTPLTTLDLMLDAAAGALDPPTPTWPQRGTRSTAPRGRAAGSPRWPRSSSTSAGSTPACLCGRSRSTSASCAAPRSPSSWGARPSARSSSRSRARERGRRPTRTRWRASSASCSTTRCAPPRGRAGHGGRRPGARP